MDRLTKQQRSSNMAAIHGKDTKPEMVVRKWLWGHGFRYRLNHKRLPGKPDIVMRKYRTCIFVNGCFWHGHGVAMPPVLSEESEQVRAESLEFRVESSECCKIPKTNREIWVAKIQRNQERDLKVQHELAAMGWHSITIWECELKPKVREKTLESLAFTLNKIFLLNFSTQAQSDDLQDHSVRRYEIPEEEPMMAAEDVPTEHGNKAT